MKRAHADQLVVCATWTSLQHAIQEPATLGCSRQTGAVYVACQQSPCVLQAIVQHVPIQLCGGAV